MIFLLALLAEMVDPAKFDWSVLSSFGGAGFAMWYGWYTTTYTIPGIVKDHKATVDLIMQSHEKQIDKIVLQVKESSCRFNAHEHV